MTKKYIKNYLEGVKMLSEHGELESLYEGYGFATATIKMKRSEAFALAERMDNLGWKFLTDRRNDEIATWQYDIGEPTRRDC